MLLSYIHAAMKKAKYEILEDDNSFYGEIPGFEGVYANEENLELCRSSLEEILEEWIFLRISNKFQLPVVDGLDLKIKEVS